MLKSLLLLVSIEDSIVEIVLLLSYRSRLHHLVPWLHSTVGLVQHRDSLLLLNSSCLSGLQGWIDVVKAVFLRLRGHWLSIGYF